MIDNELLGIVDGTYQGEGSLLLVPPCPYNPENERVAAIHLILSQKRILIENFYARMKGFDVLTTKFRHDLALHKIVFLFILNILTVEVSLFPLRAIQ